MILEHSITLTRFYKALDVSLVVVSFVAAYYIRRNVTFWGLTGALPVEPNYYLVLFLIILIAPIVFRLAGFYKLNRSQNIYQIAIRVGKAVVGILGGVIFVLFLIHETGISRMLLGLFSVILTVSLFLSKSFLHYTLQYHLNKSYNKRNVIVVGNGPRAKRMIDSLKGEKTNGYQILGYISIDNDQKNPFQERDSGEIIRLGKITLLPTLLMKQVVDEIIFATDLGKIDFINEYIQFAEELGVNIRILPDFQLEKIMYHSETAYIYVQEFAGIPTLALSTLPHNYTGLLVKSCLDYLIAGLGLIILSPILLLIAFAIKSSSKGTVFFLQDRSGLYGRVFKVIKFRTMVDNAEELKKFLNHKNEVDGPVFKINNDPRITRIGKFLRKTSLDEVPQLLNVLMGHMSLVGPRPLPVEEKPKEPWQRRRLSMKPGITCIWQVSGRNDVDFDSWMRMDLEYIDNWSLLLDFKILVKTVKEVASCHGR